MAEPVKIVTDVQENAQDLNETLQFVGAFAFSIGTNMEVPTDVYVGGQQMIADWLKAQCEKMNAAVPNATFIVEVGWKSDWQENWRDRWQFEGDDMPCPQCLTVGQLKTQDGMAYCYNCKWKRRIKQTR